ncbi:hypothetical protein AVEN_175595-1 [Araneus ventricosus]|uniref:Uncharacterized protein n=1 Tax=Araneus ventricosus TaxID=182803 RepID=A0A4Y2G3P9_ARAVE|nr:hypothetical protein AVEN_175595-1 [Araneus ventricosus]
MDRRIWKNFKQDTRVSLLMRCAEEWRQIRLSNQSPPKLQWCSARVQNAYMRSGNACIISFIVPNKSRPPHAGGGLPTGPLPVLHPFWVGRASVGVFTPHQREGVWPLRMI